MATIEKECCPVCEADVSDQTRVVQVPMLAANEVYVEERILVRVCSACGSLFKAKPTL